MKKAAVGPHQTPPPHFPLLWSHNDGIFNYRAMAPTAIPPSTIASARPAPGVHKGVSARAPPVVELEDDAPDPEADEAADANEEAPDANEESAEDATERAEDAADEAPDAMDEAADAADEAADEADCCAEEREAEIDPPGAVAVAEEVPDLAELVAEDGGAAGAPTLNVELLATTLLVSDPLRKLTKYDPGEISWGKRTVIWFFCGSTLFAIARPPAKVLLSELKTDSVNGLLSEESDDQVMVTLEPVVADEGTCKFDNAAAVAANARAAMA